MKLHNRQRAHTLGWYAAERDVSITENPFTHPVLCGDWETGHMDRVGTGTNYYRARHRAFAAFYNEHREPRERARVWR